MFFCIKHTLSIEYFYHFIIIMLGTKMLFPFDFIYKFFYFIFFRLIFLPYVGKKQDSFSFCQSCLLHYY